MSYSLMAVGLTKWWILFHTQGCHISVFSAVLICWLEPYAWKCYCNKKKCKPGFSRDAIKKMQVNQCCPLEAIDTTISRALCRTTFLPVTHVLVDTWSKPGVNYYCTEYIIFIWAFTEGGFLKPNPMDLTRLNMELRCQYRSNVQAMPWPLTKGTTSDQLPVK